MIIVFVCAARVNVSRSETTIITFDDLTESTEYSVDLDGDTQADVRFTTSVNSGFRPDFPGCEWFSDIRFPALGGYYASPIVDEHEVVVEFLTPVTDSLAFDFAVSGPISTSRAYIQVFDNDDPFRYAANNKEAVSDVPCGPGDAVWSEGSIEVHWSGWTADYAYVNFYTTGGGFTLDNFEVTPVVCNGDCDRDGDGLTDVVEENGCTDPYDADTDDDGILDGDEDKNHNGVVDSGETDPCEGDTDDDGMPDGWEVQHSLNPLADDANGDLDGDLFTNVQEYLKGTAPDDPSSVPPNNAPTAPGLNYPANDAETDSREPIFSISNSTDLDWHTLTYSFEIYSDHGLTSLMTSVSEVQEGENTTAWEVDTTLDDNSFYYWRSRAYDGIGYSDWMGTAKFFVNTSNDAPSIPTNSSPPDQSEVATLQPTLGVNNAGDVDLDPLTYDFELYSDENMSTPVISTTGVVQGDAGTTSWQIDILLQDNTFYWWRAQARDNEDESSGWTDLFSFFVNTYNDPPSIPTISSPQNGGEVNTLDPALVVNNSTDADLDVLTYFFEIDKVNTFSSASLEQSREVPEGSGDTTLWSPSQLDENTTYYWRAKAYDGLAYSQWTTVSFFVNVSNDAPTIPTINNPGDNTEVITLTPTLVVNPSIDLDLDQITYDFELYSDGNLSNLVTSTGDAGESWEVDVSLVDNVRYYWRARAVDEHGAASDWSAAVSFLVNVNYEPTVPSLNNPVSGGTVTSLTPSLSVNNSTDLDNDSLDYEFEVYSDQNLSKQVAFSTVLQGNLITSWAVSPTLTDNTTYYWRARANDGNLVSSWMPTAVFVVNTSGGETTVVIAASQDVSTSAQTTKTVEVTDANSPINGVCVEIPQGALTDDCTITLGQVINPPALPANTKAIGRVIEFGPWGITFAIPVSIMIPYTQADLDNAGVSDPAQLEVFTYHTSTLSWEKIPVDSVDYGNGFLICEVDHFSMYTTGKSVTLQPDDGGGGAGGGGGGGGGCSIATAAFGSPMETHVSTLRNFRDTYLLPCALGRIFVRTYNKYSPSLAQFIAKHEMLKVAVRISLLPLVVVSYSMLQFGPVITLTMLVVLLMLGIVLVSFYRRKVRSYRANN